MIRPPTPLQVRGDIRQGWGGVVQVDIFHGSNESTGESSDRGSSMAFKKP